MGGLKGRWLPGLGFSSLCPLFCDPDAHGRPIHFVWGAAYTTSLLQLPSLGSVLASPCTKGFACCYLHAGQPNQRVLSWTLGSAGAGFGRTQSNEKNPLPASIWKLHKFYLNRRVKASRRASICSRGMKQQEVKVLAPVPLEDATCICTCKGVSTAGFGKHGV